MHKPCRSDGSSCPVRRGQEVNQEYEQAAKNVHDSCDWQAARLVMHNATVAVENRYIPILCNGTWQSGLHADTDPSAYLRCLHSLCACGGWLLCLEGPDRPLSCISRSPAKFKQVSEGEPAPVLAVVDAKPKVSADGIAKECSTIDESRTKPYIFAFVTAHCAEFLIWQSHSPNASRPKHISVWSFVSCGREFLPIDVGVCWW